jgi:hypothetical protein
MVNPEDRGKMAMGAPMNETISFDKELDRLLRLLAVQRALERQIRRPTLVLQSSETAEAQAILAAQNRLKRNARRSDLHPKRTDEVL